MLAKISDNQALLCMIHLIPIMCNNVQCYALDATRSSESETETDTSLSYL